MSSVLAPPRHDSLQGDMDSAARIGEFFERKGVQRHDEGHPPFHTEQLEVRQRDDRTFQQGLGRNGLRAVSEFARAEQIWAGRRIKT
jgi:hypothetical protein